MATILLNGKEHDLPAPLSVHDLLSSLGHGDKPVVVELNGAALTPSEHQSTLVTPDSRVEIVTLAAGG